MKTLIDAFLKMFEDNFDVFKVLMDDFDAENIKKNLTTRQVNVFSVQMHFCKHPALHFTDFFVSEEAFIWIREVIY